MMKELLNKIENILIRILNKDEYEDEIIYSYDELIYSDND